MEASLYEPDHRGTYRVAFSYFFRRPRVFAYGNNLLIGKFRHAVCFTQRVYTHAHIVRNVLFARSPVKVICAVVALIPIAMAHFMLRWAWPTKHQSHQPMDICIPFASFFSQFNRVISGGADIRSKYFLWCSPLAIPKRHCAWETSNLPFVRHLVKPFVFWYRFPSFHA